jgi:hypothetical protein
MPSGAVEKAVVEVTKTSVRTPVRSVDLNTGPIYDKRDKKVVLINALPDWDSYEDLFADVQPIFENRSGLTLINSTPTWDEKDSLFADRQPVIESRSELVVINSTPSWSGKDNLFADVQPTIEDRSNLVLVTSDIS